MLPPRDGTAVRGDEAHAAILRHHDCERAGYGGTEAVGRAMTRAVGIDDRGDEVVGLEVERAAYVADVWQAAGDLGTEAEDSRSAWS